VLQINSFGISPFDGKHEKWHQQLAASCCTIVKPAETTPTKYMVVWRLIAADVVPPGVINVVDVIAALSGHTTSAFQIERAKSFFTGEDYNRDVIMQYASENLIPVTRNWVGKSPFNIFLNANVSRCRMRFLRQSYRRSAVMFAIESRTKLYLPQEFLVHWRTVMTNSWRRVIEGEPKLN